MLEKLADHDDELMEQLLADIPPPRDKVFDDLAKELRDGLVVPVLMGVATRTNGVLRLLKALRHEAPNVETTAKRLGVKGSDAARLCAQDAQHRACRQDVGRARAVRARSATASRSIRPSARPAASPARSSCSARPSRSAGRPPPARPSRFGKLEYAKTGDTLVGRQADACRAGRTVEPHPPVLAISIAAKERKDDVKLGQALHKLVDEDPSITIVHNPETHEVVMWGQGEMHLRVAAERLADRFGVAIETRPAERRLSRDHQEDRSSSAAGTRSSPAATASSATWCSTSSRCRAARASSSRTRSPAAWCRATTSRRSRRA